MSWYASAASDSRAELSGTLSGVTKNGDVYTFQGNSAARYNIMTTSGYHPELVIVNHAQLAARGYMQSPNDWRDIEMTAYVNITASTDDQMVMYCRGGKHNNDNAGCEGFAYKLDLYFSGGVRVAKEQWHNNGYVFGNEQPAMGSIEGKWVGMKSVVYNNTANTEVTMEIWLDKNADNNWVKALTYVDKGGFGNQGGHCGGVPDQVGTWGGPFATYRWDNVDTIDMKFMSVREISPTGEFTDGGSNPGGGQGDGGTGGTGTGSGGGVICVDNPVVVIGGGDTGGVVAGDSDKTLYKLTGRTEKFVEEPFGIRHYNSGKPDSVTKEWNIENSDFENAECTFYITITNPDDDADAISVKFYGPHHQDGQGAWYIFDIEFDNGKSGWGYEQPHPTTTSFSDVGDSVGSIIGKKVGIKAVIWKKGSGAHCESWFDKGDNVWKKTTSLDNPGGKLFSLDSNCQQQIRIDAAPHIAMVNPTYKEITPNGEFVGSGGGGGTTTGGGQTCTPIPDDPGGGGGGGTTGGGGGGQPEQQQGTPSGSGGGSQNDGRPLMTVSRDFTFLLNVGIDTADNCTAGNPLEPKTYDPIYNVQGDTGVYTDLGYTVIYTDGATEVGVFVNTTRSVLYNQIVRKVVVSAIKRTVDSLSQSCTGSLYCLIINYSESAIRRTIGNPINVAGIDVNEQTVEFIEDDNDYQLKVGDMIVLRYASNDANPDKCLKVRMTNRDTFDSVNSYLISKIYNGYFGRWDQDIGFTVFT